MPTPSNATDSELTPPTRARVLPARDRNQRPSWWRRAASSGLNRLANVVSPQQQPATA
jgi:hypothetical protein